MSNETTSERVASLAATGLSDPSKLSLEEIQSVCASALTQVADTDRVKRLEQAGEKFLQCIDDQLFQHDELYGEFKSALECQN